MQSECLRLRSTAQFATLKKLGLSGPPQATVSHDEFVTY